MYTSAKQGDPQIDLPPIPSSQTIKRVFKNPEEAASFEAQMQMASETLPIVKSLRRGEISYGEAKEQFYALSPRQDSDSPLFNEKCVLGIEHITKYLTTTVLNKKTQHFIP